MSYKIGQLRKSQIQNYDTKIDLYASNFEQKEYNFPGLNFTYNDYVLTLSKDLACFEKNINYYLKFTVNSNGAKFKVKLISSRDSSKAMLIKEFKFTASNVPCELVFTPNDSVYDTILFEKERNDITDISALNLKIDEGVNESTPLKEVDLRKLENILSIIQTFPNYGGLTYLKRMGLQGPSGFLFSMNGDEFYIGKSGIFEVDDININNLSFVISELPADAGYFDKQRNTFIMDFQY